MLLIISVEGTIVVKQDFYLETHSADLAIPNIEVLSLLKSFKSKAYVRETFNWRFHYYYLTPEGITYLRQYLALPEDVVPATLKAPATARTAGRPGMFCYCTPLFLDPFSMYLFSMLPPLV